MKKEETGNNFMEVSVISTLEGIFDESVRELTFEEEVRLYKEEARAIFEKEEGDSEAPMENQIIRRGIRIIRKAEEKIDELLRRTYYVRDIASLSKFKDGVRNGIIVEQMIFDHTKMADYCDAGNIFIMYETVNNHPKLSRIGDLTISTVLEHIRDGDALVRVTLRTEE